MLDRQVSHDPSQHKFFITFPEGEAVLLYKQIDDETLDFYRTFVPPERRGGNIAALLVKTGLAYANQHHYNVIPGCSYVAEYIKRHPK